MLFSRIMIIAGCEFIAKKKLESNGFVTKARCKMPQHSSKSTWTCLRWSRLCFLGVKFRFKIKFSFRSVVNGCVIVTQLRVSQYFSLFVIIRDCQLEHTPNDEFCSPLFSIFLYLAWKRNDQHVILLMTVELFISLDFILISREGRRKTFHW